MESTTLIRRILFSSDLSEDARHSFAFTMDLAGACGAEILILHVMDKLAPGTEERVATAFGPELYERLKHRKAESAQDILIGKKTAYARHRERMNRVLRQAYGDAAVDSDAVAEIHVTEGDMVEKTLALARQAGCQLIVIGAHSRGRLQQAFTDGPVRKLLRHSDIPVLVVPARSP